LPDPGPVPFSLEVRADRDRLLVRLSGEVDMASVARVRAAVRDARDGGWQHVVLDLKDIEFIDSQGLHLLLDVDREAREDGWEFGIVDGAPPLVRLLEISGLADRFRRETR
jgi:anti-anti-sigma factor